jgi:hypothetical protein
MMCPECGQEKPRTKEDAHYEHVQRLSILPANFPVIGAVDMAKLYGWESMWRFQTFGANVARAWEWAH